MIPFRLIFWMMLALIVTQGSLTAAQRRESKFRNAADSLEWWLHRRFLLDGMKPYTPEEQSILRQIANNRRLADVGAKVLVVSLDSRGIRDTSKVWQGAIAGRRNLVFFTIRDSSGNESEHHLFKIEFLERDPRPIKVRPFTK